jgi:hypothetical protein
MLCHLLAELVQHLFAIATFVEHLKTAVDLAIHADRLAEKHKIGTLDQRQSGDKDQDIDDRFNGHHRAYSAIIGSKMAGGRS